MEAEDAALRLYTIEYQKAAERYDHIYRSMWLIFSYLTAVGAGFLAFGSDIFEPHALIAIAAIPVLFWFWTTYLPLDRYGNRTVKRLAEIECLLNHDFHTQMNHFTNFAHPLGLWESLRKDGQPIPTDKTISAEPREEHISVALDAA